MEKTNRAVLILPKEAIVGKIYPMKTEDCSVLHKIIFSNVNIRIVREKDSLKNTYFVELSEKLCKSFVREMQGFVSFN